MKHSLLFVLLAGITFSLQAQIPRVLSYQGVFSDTLGTLKPDGTYSFTFKLYDFPSGGAAVWSETKDLEVKGGVFSTQLGNMTPFASQSFDVPFWLGITVGPDPEIVPRVALSSVPYSMNAVRADTAAFALSTPVPPSSDSARIAGALALPFEGTVSAVGQAMAITNSKGSAIYAEADSGSALDAYSINGNAVYATTDKSTGIGLYATAYSLTGLNYGVIGMSYSNSGLGGFFKEGWAAQRALAMGPSGGPSPRTVMVSTVNRPQAPDRITESTERHLLPPATVSTAGPRRRPGPTSACMGRRLQPTAALVSSVRQQEVPDSTTGCTAHPTQRTAMRGSSREKCTSAGPFRKLQARSRSTTRSIPRTNIFHTRLWNLRT